MQELMSLASCAYTELHFLTVLYPSIKNPVAWKQPVHGR